MSTRPPPHPRVLTRNGLAALRNESRPEVLVYAPETYIHRWIEDELVGTHTIVQVARRIPEVITALVHDAPPRPRVLLLQVDGVPASELLSLRELRDAAWTGTIVAIGHHGIPHAFKLELQIEYIVRAPFLPDQLRTVIEAVVGRGDDSIFRKLTVPMERLG